MTLKNLIPQPQRSPYFSVIIPTYNGAEKLRRALVSVGSQSFRNFEVIVCDDGSTDDTKEIVRSFAGRMKLIYLWEENWGGPARPRNRGLAVAEGEWACFLDADDWWYPEKLATVYFAISSAGWADVIHHDSDVFNSGGRKLLRQRGRQLKEPVFVDLMTGWNALHTSTVCVRKAVLDQVGEFCEERDLIAIEDFDLWIRLARANCLFLHIPRVLGAYWADDVSISSFSKVSIARETAVHQRYLGYLDGKYRREAEKMLFYRKGIVLWHMGQNRESRKMFVAALGARRIRTCLLTPFWILLTLCFHSNLNWKSFRLKRFF